MGHKHQDEQQGVEPTQGQVEQSVALGVAAADLPPDSEEMRKGHALLGRGARVNIARMLTVVLSNYDLTTNTYWGKVINANKAEADAPFKDGDYVPGLKRYPWTANPKDAFQFVLCGEDESVLVNIANQNIRDRQPTEVVSEG